MVAGTFHIATSLCALHCQEFNTQAPLTRETGVDILHVKLIAVPRVYVRPNIIIPWVANRKVVANYNRWHLPSNQTGSTIYLWRKMLGQQY